MDGRRIRRAGDPHEAAEKEWIEELKNKIEAGYNPHSAVIAEIPKGNGAVRPAALLHVEDRVVYSAAIGALFGPIYAGLQWCQGKIDFSYRRSKAGGLVHKPVQ
jgi:hypothetical protein